MSSNYSGVEQDSGPPSGQNELPTYDDLAAQNGPNSRFGRWRGWIEKRAAERYLETTVEERNRRKQRGWGNDSVDHTDFHTRSSTASITAAASPPSLSQLHIQTEGNQTVPEPSMLRAPTPPLPPLPSVSKRLTPTRLKINQFGSRFLPHTTSPIRCLLPLESDRLLLIGHDEGLSVLEMFPQDWLEDGSIVNKGPDEAHAKLIWQGESVLQMSLLEVESLGEGKAQGVVLALVGPEPGSPSAKDPDSMRSLRMYNLASLNSLAQWAVTQKGARPLDLHRPSNWQVQQSPKRARPQSSSSFARGLKALIDHPTASHLPEPAASSYDNMLSPTPRSASTKRQSVRPAYSPPQRSLTPNRRPSDESTWDVVEDLPLRWATDFVPLATSGSRLSNVSVISYALWGSENHRGRGGHLLAIATKNNILLYETPKGERAFRFVKELYTPLQPRSITFFQQSVHDVDRHPFDLATPKQFQSHKRSDSASTLRAVSDSSRASMLPTPTINYGTHLAIFVGFDKKAGWIRIADAAVGEMELHDFGDGHQHRASDTLSTSSILKSRMSLEGHQIPRWIQPVKCALPVPHKPSVTRDVLLLTRGKTTHIVPYPLPIGHSSYPPLHVVVWRSAPTTISSRVSQSSPEGRYSPFLQLIGLGGEYGVEVQEIALSFMGKGKGKSHQLEEPLRADEDQGGDTGFLCIGGHWDQYHQLLHRPDLNRSYSSSSAVSGNSFTSMESNDLLERRQREEGLYGWCRKGLEDWRVFWLGGSLTSNADIDSE